MKISKSTGVLYKQSSFLPIHIMKTLHYTLIYPYLRYSTESWYGASLKMSRAIQIQQEKAIRAIFHLRHNHLPHYYFRNHSIMKIKEIHKLNPSRLQPFCSNTIKDREMTIPLVNLVVLQNCIIIIQSVIGHWSTSTQTLFG